MRRAVGVSMSMVGAARWGGRATLWLQGALPAFALAGGVLMGVPSAAASERQPTVHTKDGWLRGARSGGVDRYLAVPYAAPPVGALRWRPPAAPRPWRGVRAADTLPPRCAQIGEGGGQEDCLYLNVYRPSHPRRSGRLPVLFYIHGGSLKVGSAIDNDPSRIASTTDTLVVMINYRLGHFGFLAHPALGDEAGDGTSGEYGLMDQQAALRWVRESITAFGGDPERVTIAGGSAGAFSVCAHLVSDAAQDLFSGVVIQSGACPSRPLATAEARGIEFATAAGCPQTSSTDCLRGKTTEELLAADSWDWEAVLVSGGRLLPEAPAEAVASGRFARVPVMIGGVRDEARGPLSGLFPMTEQTYVALATQTFGDAAPAVLDEYPSSAYGDPFFAFTAAGNDSGVGGIGACVNRELANALAEHVPTYVYEFDDPDAPVPAWQPLPPGMVLGSSHGSDEMYWFDRPFDAVEPLAPPQRWLARQMVEYLGAFVERGNPRVLFQPRFPRFDERERVLLFRPGAVRALRDFSRAHHCEFWDSIGY